MRLIALLLLSGYLTGCAGPATPFGAVSTVTPDSRKLEEKPTPSMRLHSEKPKDIVFHPKRQTLHNNSDLRISLFSISSKTPDRYLKIYYDQMDVTEKFLAQAETFKMDGAFHLKFKDLNLSPTRGHKIEISYNEPNRPEISAEYLPPACSMLDYQKVANTGPFSPPKEYLKWIEKYSMTYKANPSLLTGLIAQESGFNSKAVSWAKAIGLTQITPLAEEQILADRNFTPRYPELNDHSYPRIKSLIYRGKLNGAKEWRLNPELSILGGLTYIQFLQEYWGKTSNKKILQNLKGNPELNLTRVLLASYNSGAARVKYAIHKKGDFWLTDHKLKEANKYVNRIMSYCYHFADQKNYKGASL